MFLKKYFKTLWSRVLNFISNIKPCSQGSGIVLPKYDLWSNFMCFAVNIFLYYWVWGFRGLEVLGFIGLGFRAGGFRVTGLGPRV